MLKFWARLTATAVIGLGLAYSGQIGRSIVTIQPAAADTGTQIIVHYHRFAGDYGMTPGAAVGSAEWNLWMWPHEPTSGNGSAYKFESTDAFGAVAHANVPGLNTSVGVIVRLDDWKAKDISQDRFINTPNHQAEVWLIQDDPTIYATADAAQRGLEESKKIKPVHAYLDGTRMAAVKFSHALDLSGIQMSNFSVTDTVTGQTIAIDGVTDFSGSPTARADLVQAHLAAEPDVTHRLILKFANYQSIDLVPRLVLNDQKYYYAGNDLGAVYSPEATSFRLWAPLASSVDLLMYRDDTGKGEQTVAMTPGANGTWTVKVTGDQKNAYYLYRVVNFDVARTAVDPYARNIAVNGTYGQVVDLRGTDPGQWSSDTYRKTGSQTNASIYEVHVRDFSINPNSGIAHRGKYLAFTETGTHSADGTRTGLDSLKQLGVTHVELLPTQGCETLDEVLGGKTDPAPNGDGSRYNWCYDPRNYFAPNGAYATNPRGPTRITEFKQMVQGIHRAGQGVIMDVVYNHTHSSGIFDSIVPGYYYRQDYVGNVFDFAGPNVASERPMVAKLIEDSVLYWAREYHVDGFRFDAMSLLGKKLMTRISQSLHTLNPSAVILGEPWSLLPAGWQDTYGHVDDVEMTKGEQRGLGIGVFNDNIRNGLEGDVFHATEPGYATGSPSQQVAIRNSLTGSINYSFSITGFAQNPDEAINYVSSHDNATLWDRINSDAKAQHASTATKIRMDELAAGIVFTAQGVPFMQGGDEFLRTKSGNDNSYIAGDTVNEFNWARKRQYAAVFKYYAGLIHLRAAHPAFRMNHPDQVTRNLIFLNSPRLGLAFMLKNHANADSWKTIVVMYNPYPKALLWHVQRGRWTVVATAGRAGTRSLGHVQTRVSVPGYSMEILHQ